MLGLSPSIRKNGKTRGTEYQKKGKDKAEKHRVVGRTNENIKSIELFIIIYKRKKKKRRNINGIRWK